MGAPGGTCATLVPDEQAALTLSALARGFPAHACAQGKAVVAAAAGKRHTVVLTAEGEVFTWGHRGVSPRRVELKGARDAWAASSQQLWFHRGHTGVFRPQAVAICAGGRGHSCRGHSCRAHLPQLPLGSGSGPTGSRQAMLAAALFFPPLVQRVGFSGTSLGARSHAANPFSLLHPLTRARPPAPRAGAAHTSVLTATGVVLCWRSADPALAVQEVGGGLAGKRVVSISAGGWAQVPARRAGLGGGGIEWRIEWRRKLDGAFLGACDDSSQSFGRRSRASLGGGCTCRGSAASGRQRLPSSARRSPQRAHAPSLGQSQ